MKRRLILGLAAVLALTGIAVGIVGIIASQDGANSLGVVASSAALGAVLLTLAYTRLREADQKRQ